MLELLHDLELAVLVPLVLEHLATGVRSCPTGAVAGRAPVVSTVSFLLVKYLLLFLRFFPNICFPINAHPYGELLDLET